VLVFADNVAILNVETNIHLKSVDRSFHANLTSFGAVGCINTPIKNYRVRQKSMPLRFCCFLQSLGTSKRNTCITDIFGHPIYTLLSYQFKVISNTVMPFSGAAYSKTSKKSHSKIMSGPWPGSAERRCSEQIAFSLSPPSILLSVLPFYPFHPDSSLFSPSSGVFHYPFSFLSLTPPLFFSSPNPVKGSGRNFQIAASPQTRRQLATCASTCRSS